MESEKYYSGNWLHSFRIVPEMVLLVLTAIPCSDRVTTAVHLFIVPWLGIGVVSTAAVGILAYVLVNL